MLTNKLAGRERSLEAATEKHRLLLPVDLDAVSAGLDGEQTVLVVDFDVAHAPEGLLSLDALSDFPLVPHLGVGVQLVLAPLGDGGVPGQGVDQVAFRAVDAYLFIAPVGDVNQSLAVGVDAGGTVQVSLAVLLEELAVGRELLNAVVAPVGDKDVAVLVDGDSPGQAKFAGARASVPHLEMN